MKFISHSSTFSVLIAIFVLAIAASAAKPGKSSSAERAGLTVVNDSTNVWYSQSSDGPGAVSMVEWGLEGDIRVPADYDGDGINDIAVWRPSNGVWYISRSSDGGFVDVGWGLTTSTPTGGIADVPVPADYDGDGADDIAVWRPSEGRWYILRSSTGFYPPKADIVYWGLLGDIPVPADYDGDGRTDIAVFRSTQNRWYIANSKTGHFDIRTFGNSGFDLLVPADYTGDGKADLAVYRQGTWFVQDSSTGETEPFKFGFADAQPVPADYDGDGTTDFAVYRRGIWYIYDSRKPRFRTQNFGREGDIPLNSLSVKPSIVALP